MALAASFVIVAIIGYLNGRGEPARVDVAGATVASADSGGTGAESVLVSLMAGSEVVEPLAAESPQAPSASAMSLLRARDASFNDLNSEVQLILASAQVR